MKILEKIKAEHFFEKPVVLTIGFFDGVHLGHSKIFKRMNALKGMGCSVVITFKNHPTTLLNPHHPTPCIFPLEQKVELLQQEKVDVLFLLDFTQAIRDLSADDFIDLLFEHLPFEHLVLGPNSSIGKDRKGNSERLYLLSKKYGFSFHEVSYDFYKGELVSSTRIRRLIQEGKLEQTKELLNKNYALKLRVVEGQQRGKALGFPTLNFEIEGLVHPPLGVYEVEIKLGDTYKKGIANLGFAPTLKSLKNPVLEVHVLDAFDFPKIKEAEILFKKFIRAEQKFNSIDELKLQIQKDIESLLD